MPRFYLPQQIQPQSQIDLPDNIVRHIQVLRMQPGDALTLFNGEGGEYQAELSELGKRRAQCRITAFSDTDRESPLAIRLIQAVSSGERMDFTIQKSVELGVAEIRPIISERCVVRLSGERADKRVARWQEIAVAACEQSGRNTVPRILPILSLRDYLAQIPRDELHLLMSLNRAQTLAQIPCPSKLNLMIGPEGGWSAAEEEQAFAAGFQSLTLGKRVLRTETASLAALAAMQALWGDF